MSLPLKTIPSSSALASGPSPPVDISKGTQEFLAIILLLLTVFGPFFTSKDVPSVHTNVLLDTTLFLAVSVNCPGSPLSVAHQPSEWFLPCLDAT